MNIPRIAKKLGWSILAFIFAIASSYLCAELVNRNTFFNELENKTLTELQFLVTPLDARKDILIVATDQESAKKLEPNNPGGSINRRTYGKLIKELAEAKASVIVSDILFVDSSPQQDPEFFGLVDQAIQTGNSSIVFSADRAEEAFEDWSEPDGIAYSFLIAPELLERRPRIDIGFALPFDPDEIVVGCIPFKRDATTNELYAHTALLATWRHLRQKPEDAKIDQNSIRTPGWDSQLGTNGDLPLLWTKEKEAIQTISLIDALDQLEKGDYSNFRDRIVLFGDYRDGSDVKPVHKQGEVRGTLILANMINTLLAPSSQRVKWLNQSILVFIIVLIAGISGIALQTRKKYLQLAAVTSPFIFGLLVPWFLASSTHLIIPTVYPFLTISFALIVGLLTLAFQAPNRDTRIAGDLSEATILFSDLTGSTIIVQKLGAVEYQRIYSEWLDVCELHIQKHGGHVERTTGDGFIAVFPQVPVISTPECLEACQKILATMQDPDFEATFGFESGPVSGGYLVEAGRKVWSSSGTTVNMAKRLQTITGQLNQKVIFGPIAARTLKESMPVQSLGSHELKGIEGTVECFTVDFCMVLGTGFEPVTPSV